MPEAPESATPETSPDPRRDTEAPIPFEQRFKIPAGFRVVRAKPGSVTVVIGAASMKLPAGGSAEPEK